MPERKSFLLRIDPALWNELESWAAQDLRSVNAQIEFLLRQAVQNAKARKPPPPHHPPLPRTPMDEAKGYHILKLSMTSFWAHRPGEDIFHPPYQLKKRCPGCPEPRNGRNNTQSR